MKVLVTGGAGFIGSNFVIRARQVRPEWRLTVLDSMTYAANLSSLDPVLGDVDVVKGSVTDPDLVDELVAAHDIVVHFAADSHNDNSPRRPVALHRHQHRGDLPARPGGAPARQAPAPHLHRRGLRRPRARRPGQVHRDDAAQPLQPLLRLQGQRRPAGAGLDPLLRPQGHPVELLQQLRPAPARREVHPAPDHRDPRRRQAQALRRRRQRARLDPRRRPQRRRHRHHRAGPARRDLPHRRRRRDEQPRRHRPDPRAHGQAGRLVRARPRPPRATTCATRSTPPSCGPRPTGGPPTPTCGRAWPTPSRGTRTTRTGGAPPRSSPRRGTSGWAADDPLAGHRRRRHARPGPVRGAVGGRDPLHRLAQRRPRHPRPRRLLARRSPGTTSW